MQSRCLRHTRTTRPIDATHLGWVITLPQDWVKWRCETSQKSM
jgi:hypothetical protein